MTSPQPIAISPFVTIVIPLWTTINMEITDPSKDNKHRDHSRNKRENCNIYHSPTLPQHSANRKLTSERDKSAIAYFMFGLQFFINWLIVILYKNDQVQFFSKELYRRTPFLKRYFVEILFQRNILLSFFSFLKQYFVACLIKEIFYCSAFLKRYFAYCSSFPKKYLVVLHC